MGCRIAVQPQTVVANRIDEHRVQVIAAPAAVTNAAAEVAETLEMAFSTGVDDV
jgi:hypothetical protein